jgi:hypothetical protein
MTCGESRRAFWRVLAGEIDSESAGSFRRHRQSCRECFVEIQRVQELMTGLPRSAPRPVAAWNDYADDGLRRLRQERPSLWRWLFLIVLGGLLWGGKAIMDAQAGKEQSPPTSEIPLPATETDSKMDWRDVLEEFTIDV